MPPWSPAKPRPTPRSRTKPPTSVAASIAKNWESAQAAAAKEDFNEALALLDTVTESLVGYETLAEQYQALSVAYRERFKTLSPRLEKAEPEVVEQGLSILREKILAARDEMLQAADAGDFEKAMEARRLFGSRAGDLRDRTGGPAGRASGLQGAQGRTGAETREDGSADPRGVGGQSQNPHGAKHGECPSQGRRGPL